MFKTAHKKFSLSHLLAPFAAIAVTLSLTGCAAFNYVQRDAPVALLKPQALPTKPKIAIVLGSGGPRGYAHVGIIKVLEEAGIRPELIVGTSVGSVIGAFWASGMSAAEIETQAFSGGPLTLFDLNPFADRGWIRGERLQDYVATRLSYKNIENSKIPLIIGSTRRADKVPVFFTNGNIAVAIRASSAVPGVISPVGINHVEYEDGDVSMPVAVSAAKAAGADFVIAIDVSAVPGSAPANTDARWLARDAQRRRLIDPEVAQADFLIHPDMGYMASPFRDFFLKAYASGESTMRAQLPALKTKLDAHRKASGRL